MYIKMILPRLIIGYIHLFLVCIFSNKVLISYLDGYFLQFVPKIMIYSTAQLSGSIMIRLLEVCNAP